MRSKPSALGAAALALILVGAAAGQTDCEKGGGPLRSAPPDGMTPFDVIRQFTFMEAKFKANRMRYTYTQDLTIQTLTYNGADKSFVDGEFRQVTEVSVDDRGRRTEQIVFAPQSSLRRLAMTPQDMEDIRSSVVLPLTHEDAPDYDISYRGQQRVDTLDTYVFDVVPKTVKRGKRYFQGRVWVESRDLAIVKTCGKSVDVEKKENLHPTFVTYREQVDDVYWFPSYARSDDWLPFRNGAVRIREIVRFQNYRQLGSRPPTASRDASPSPGSGR
jgi:hypothetical protein